MILRTFSSSLLISCCAFIGANAQEQSTTTPLGDTPLHQAREQIWESWVEQADQEGWDELWPEPQKVEDILTTGEVNGSLWSFEGENNLIFTLIVKGERPENGWPLFWCTHGGGSNPDTEGAHTWMVNSQEWSAQIQLSCAVYDSPGIYFIPRMMDDRRGRWWMATEQLAWEQMMRLARIYGDIDSNRIYYLGISEGGYGSHRLGPFHADHIAGVGPMAGCEPLENAPLENLRNTAFRMELGEGDHMFDRNALVYQVQDRLAELQQENPNFYPHEVNVQKGRGHGIDYSFVVPWLAEYQRTPLPKHLTWVSWALDGRKREHFGWVGLTNIEDLGEARTRIDAVVAEESNQVHITTKQLETGSNEEGDPLNQGTLTVWLSPELVDLTRPVEIFIDETSVYSGLLESNWENLVESCQIFADPNRLMPARLQIDLSTKNQVQ